jgi:hypothetical protein
MTDRTLRLVFVVGSAAALAGCGRGESPRPTAATLNPTATAVAGTPPAAATNTPAPPAPPSAEPTPAVTSSQGIVDGTVTDAAGKPLYDVTVIVLEGTGRFAQYAVYTDAEGRYRWPLPAGTYTLEASRPGYVTAEVEAIVTAGVTTTLNIALAGTG